MKVDTLRPIEVHAAKRSARASAAEHVIPGFANPGLAADPAAWTAAFEDAYVSAAGELALVPWASDGPDPLLVGWLDAYAPGLVRPGATVSVIGCGTGDDAAELAARGYDILAFDASPTAIKWARERFPDIADCFFVADLLDPPAARRMPGRRADLVVEVETLSWLPPRFRPDAVRAAAALARPHGMVLVASTAPPSADVSGEEGTADGPIGLAMDELCTLLQAEGMRQIDSARDPEREFRRGRERFCTAFRRE